MISKKDEVTLIMKSERTATMEVWIMRHQCREHATNCVAKTSREIGEDKFRKMIRHFAHILKDTRTSATAVLWPSYYSGPNSEPKQKTRIHDVYHCKLT